MAKSKKEIVKALIDKHPDLSPSQIAKKAGCARRYVQYIKTAVNNPADRITDPERYEMEQELKKARKTLAETKKELLQERKAKETILGIDALPRTEPAWIATPSVGHASKMTGVPTLLCSDWHWGETVTHSQVLGLNQYNVTIAKERLRRLVDNTLDLLLNHTVTPTYPGIVVALMGDFVSGEIHDELTKTNELTAIAAIDDLTGEMVAMIKSFEQAFGRVFLPCVTGNHGRNTRKIESKGRIYNSFDWLLYRNLSRVFEDNPNIQFQISDGEDLQYKVFNHRYRITHGDQFRGGDGIIGPLGPITRGDFKKRTWGSQTGYEYDTLLLGHFHNYLFISDSVMVNGSMVGYNEFALRNNFKYSKPEQALFLTHETRGIIYPCTVHLDEPKKRQKAQWVSWQAA